MLIQTKSLYDPIKKMENGSKPYNSYFVYLEMSVVKPVEQYFESDELERLSKIFVPNKDEEEFIASKL